MCVNQPVFAGGNPIYSCPVNGGEPQILVPVGTPVFWNPENNLSIAQADICNHKRIYGGVSVDRNGDGIPDDIARVFNDYIDPCGIEAATAQVPVCGLSPVTDIMFDCLRRGKTYSMIIRWRDNRTENLTTQGDWDSIQIKFKVPDEVCTSCPAGMNCQHAQCEIMDIVSGNQYARFKDRFLGRRLKRRPIPVDILGLQPNFSHWNLAPVLGSNCCTNCVKINRIQSMTWTDPTTGPQNVVFTNNFVPGDPNFTYLGQLDGLVRQINTALGTTAASVVRGRDCCDSQLEIMYCNNTVVLLDNTATPIPPTNTGNPLSLITYSNSCGPCFDNASSWTPTCGLRITGKPSHPTIGCKSPRNQLAYEAMDLEVEFVDGWEDTRTFIRKVQKARTPQNTGYHMFYYDYYNNHMGGHGRPMTEYNEWAGMPFPELVGRIDGVCDKCKSGYCSFTMVRGNKGNQGVGGQSVQNVGIQPLGVDVWAIDSTNTAAIQSLQDYLNAVLACQGCPVKTPLICLTAGVLTNQELVPGELPFSGLIPS
jgi:hypothetical protein